MFFLKRHIKKKRIALFLSVWVGNLWDELILKNEILLLQKEYGKRIRFYVFTYDTKSSFLEKQLGKDFIQEYVVYCEYFPIAIRRITNVFRNIKNFFHFLYVIFICDEVVFGGGGIFFEYEWNTKHTALFQWKMRAFFCKIFQKPLRIYCVSVDVQTEKARKDLAYICKVAKDISVRDPLSKALLGSIGIVSSIKRDPVFYDAWEYVCYKKNSLLQKIPVSSFSLSFFERIDWYGKCVWVALRKWFLKDEKNILEQLFEYIQQKGGNIIFLPHSFHPFDVQSNDFLFLIQFCKKKNSISSSLEETYSYYKEKKIDICISMRLHSMILCEVYEIPYVAIMYAKKCYKII